MVWIVGKSKKKVEKSHRAHVGSIRRSSLVSTRPDASTSLSMTIRQVRDPWRVDCRASELENLCRFRPGADRQGSKALCQRRFRYSAKTRRLCSGLNFYYKSQKQFGLSTSVPSQGRQKHRFAVRPNDKTQRLLRVAGLSCRASANQLLRHRDKQKIRISNQQLCTAGSDNCPTLQWEFNSF